MLVLYLAKCVDAIKDYLDSFKAMDSAMDDRLPLEEWLRLMLAFFVAYKLSAKLIELPGWDVSFVRVTIDLEVYLASFVDRFQFARLGADSVAALYGAGLYSVFPEILDSAKISYIMARDRPHEINNTLRVHSNLGGGEFGGDSLRAVGPAHTSRGRECPATGFWRNEARQADSTGEFDSLASSDDFTLSVQQSQN